MIGYIKGKVIHSEAGVILLENNGVGYELVCSGAAFARLVTDGAGEAYTYLQVREDGLTLFGFVSMEEKNMFLKLTTVSGVGPKMGIAILSQMNINEIAVAIATSDVKGLCAVKGLGKKTAERIILELREKMGAAELAPQKGQPVIRGGRCDRRADVARLYPRGERQSGQTRQGERRREPGRYHHDRAQKHVNGGDFYGFRRIRRRTARHEHAGRTG